MLGRTIFKPKKPSSNSSENLNSAYYWTACVYVFRTFFQKTGMSKVSSFQQIHQFACMNQNTRCMQKSSTKHKITESLLQIFLRLCYTCFMLLSNKLEFFEFAKITILTLISETRTLTQHRNHRTDALTIT